jgi:predicted TIM-barrel fold metal-dependent hydrolase
MGGRASFARGSQPSTRVNFDVPANACDCHTHIFGDPKKFPFWAGRSYTPEPATPEEMSRLHRALHITRVVIVTPSVYGTDNAATLYGIKARSGRARGVAVIDEKIGDRDLDAMDKAGIRGIRVNLLTAGLTDPEVGRQRFQSAVNRIKGRGWHIQINTGLGVVTGIKDLVLESAAPVVFDHFANLRAALGVEQPGFADLVELVRSGKAYVKLSAAYHASRLADFADVAPFARALIAANPDRMLWGTNWPHPNTPPPAGRKPTEVTPFLQIDDGRVINQLPIWAPDPVVRKKILVDNAARLYGF